MVGLIRSQVLQMARMRQSGKAAGGGVRLFNLLAAGFLTTGENT
jgi:hypothetical protein